METSTNFGFNLPSRDSDDIADINQISDNFRIIDEIMKETEQTFSDISENPQSGIAVAHAVETCSPAIVTASDTAKTLSISDSAESHIKGLTGYGESTQDGTPTPDNPVEIESIENPAISVYGKNLLVNKQYSLGQTTNIAGITYKINLDGSVTINGTATSNSHLNHIVASDPLILSPGTYTVSLLNYFVSDMKVSIVVSKYAEDGSFVAILASANFGNQGTSGSPNVFTLTEPTRITTRITVGSGKTVENLTVYPQIEIGDSVTDYEQAQNPQTVTVPYTFRGLKNSSGEWTARDELRLGEGKAETKTSFKEMTFNGTENWSAYTSQSNYFQITVGDNAFGSDSVVRIACNYLPGRAAHSNAGVDYGAFSADGSRLRFKNKDISTVEEWKAWLSELSSNGTPFTVVYILANNVITDITATEAGQALLALKSNYPVTSVISDIDLYLTYRADTKNYIDNKIAALTALTLEG